MRGWLYLIKNGDLFKIGITRNLDKRMRQLRPDKIIAKLYSPEYKRLERELHKRYKNVRIPQTEYFRLTHSQIREIKHRISVFDYPITIYIGIFIRSFIILFSLAMFLVVFISLTINDMTMVIFRSLLCLEKISYCFSFISLFISSSKNFSVFNELKFRFTKLFIFVIFALLFRFASRFLI